MSRLRAVEQVPKVEPWPEIVADLGFPGPVVIGRVLGVDPIHVDDWNQRGQAPKWACLALYWLTSWGRAEVHAQAVRDAQLAMQCLRAVERERNELARRVGERERGPMLSVPEDFERLPFVEAPALASWFDSLGRERQRPASVFMGGSAAVPRGRRVRSKP